MSHMSNLDCDIQAGVVDDRRLGALWVAPEMFARFLTGGLHRCVLNDVPGGSTVRQVYYDKERLAFFVVLESETFDVVPVGAKLPVLDGPSFIGPYVGETEEVFVVRSRAELEAGAPS